MIGKEQKLTITRIAEKYNKSSIKLDIDGIDEDSPEMIGYLLLEGLGSFLSDVRKSLQKEDIGLYNEYVQDLYKSLNDILTGYYEDAETENG